ncbi:hypothetical protein HYX14_06210 [Candidatus Woesearchaeota archaeon]|nr:hypothetical protein [Candidatus Woesearchaeota archaeon]
MIAALRRGGGLDDVVRGMKPQKPEEVKPIETVGEHPFSALLEKYKAFLDDRTYGDHHKKNADLTDILNPEHINAFLQSTVIHENHEKYKERTGLFLNSLLQNSYDAGHNDFQLNTKSTKPLDYLGAFLEGTKEKPIRLTITGNVGDWCGQESTNGIYTLNGNVGEWCGWGSTYGTYMITGDVGRRCGYYSTNGIYTINGNVGASCGFGSKHGIYMITGDVGDMCGCGSTDGIYSIAGNVGVDCGLGSKHVTYMITGDVGDMCGCGSTDGIYSIAGNVGKGCGSDSKHVTYMITGDVGIGCGFKSRHGIYMITGNVGDRCAMNSTNGTYKTPHQHIAEKLKQNISKKNTIIYITPEGREEVMKE